MVNNLRIFLTRAKPFLARADNIAKARSTHKPAASLAASTECSLAYVSGVKLLPINMKKKI